MKRHTLSNKLNRHAIPGALLCVFETLNRVGSESVRMLNVTRLREMGSVDVVATVKEWSTTTLHHARLKAQMAKEKDRSELDRALVNGFGTIKTLLGVGEASKRGIVIKALDPIIKRLSSYSDNVRNSAGEYWDVAAHRMVPTTLHQVLTTRLHHERAIVLRGGAGLGKTYLARAIAAELAVMYHGARKAICDISFVFVRSR